jgi:hypothetical protein
MQCAEVGVCRNDNPVFALSPLKNFAVGGSLQIAVAHMDRIVTALPQPFSEDRRQGVVNEKFHGTVKGSPRSRTASAAQRSASGILPLEVQIGSENFRFDHAVGDHADDRCDGYAQAADTKELRPSARDQR